MEYILEHNLGAKFAHIPRVYRAYVVWSWYDFVWGYAAIAAIGYGNWGDTRFARVVSSVWQEAGYKNFDYP